MSITAFLGNTLILVALHKVTSLHAPSKLLFCKLATTDPFVGLIAEPLFVTYLISSLKERWNKRRYSFSVFNFTAYDCVVCLCVHSTPYDICITFYGVGICRYYKIKCYKMAILRCKDQKQGDSMYFRSIVLFCCQVYTGIVYIISKVSHSSSMSNAYKFYVLGLFHVFLALIIIP